MCATSRFSICMHGICCVSTRCSVWYAALKSFAALSVSHSHSLSFYTYINIFIAFLMCHVYTCTCTCASTISCADIYFDFCLESTKNDLKKLFLLARVKTSVCVCDHRLAHWLNEDHCYNKKKRLGSDFFTSFLVSIDEIIVNVGWIVKVDDGTFLTYKDHHRKLGFKNSLSSDKIIITLFLSFPLFLCAKHDEKSHFSCMYWYIGKIIFKNILTQ